MEPLDLRQKGSANPEEATKLLEPHKRWSISHWWEHFTGEPMKRWEKVVGVIVVVIFLIVFYIILDANKYRVQVRVIEGEGRVGINPTTERLDFGDLSRGTSAVRRVDIQNSSPIPMWIAVVRVGDITELMELSKNYFVLAPKTGEKIEFSVYMPASAQTDHTYYGRVFIFRIPWAG